MVRRNAPIAFAKHRWPFSPYDPDRGENGRADYLCLRYKTANFVKYASSCPNRSLLLQLDQPTQCPLLHLERYCRLRRRGGCRRERWRLQFSFSFCITFHGCFLTWRRAETITRSPEACGELTATCRIAVARTKSIVVQCRKQIFNRIWVIR